MPDPNQRYGQRQVPTHGAGPYQFDVPDIAAGGRYRLNLREYEENGTRGYYTVISEAGYDNVTIDNESNVRLLVTLNENAQFPVVPNQTRSLDREGTYDIEIQNQSDTDAAVGVSLTIERSPYGADNAERDRRTEPLARSLLRNFTGI